MVVEAIGPEEYGDHIRTMIPDEVLMWMINDQDGAAFKVAQAKMPGHTRTSLLAELINEAYRRGLINEADRLDRHLNRLADRSGRVDTFPPASPEEHAQGMSAEDRYGPKDKEEGSP